MDTVKHFKVTPTSEMETVCVVNKSFTREFNDMFGGVKYTLKPRQKVYVPKYVAKHWLGDPDLLGSREELTRIQLRLGDSYSLLESGDLYCIQFGDQTAAYQHNRPAKVLAVQEGVSIDEEDTQTQGLTTVNHRSQHLAEAFLNAGVVPEESIGSAAAYVAGEQPAV